MTTIPDFGLIETMRFDDGIPLFGRHIDRLRKSTAFFGVPLYEEAIRRLIAQECSGVDRRTPWRVRMIVDRTGAAKVTIAPVSSTEGELRVAISSTRVDARDIYLYHKTTHRSVYDREWMAAQEQGLFEILYLNHDEAVSEGSRTNIFIRTGGRWSTPPVDSGLLPGVYRSLILDTFPNVREERLVLRHLHDADALFVSNAVIGLKKVRLIDSCEEFRLLAQ